MDEFQRRFAHEAILASAGTGKTFRLTNRFLALLDAGVRPERILATTFTRKAAGEILQRVFSRLARAALNLEEAEKLAKDIHSKDMDTARCGELLATLTHRLHCLQICTLDSFFVRSAGLLALEAGLPARWAIVDEQVDRRLRDRAVEGLFRALERDEVARLMQVANRQRFVRRVFEQVQSFVAEAHGLYATTAPEAWGIPTEGHRLSDEDLAACLRRLEKLEVPRTAKGTPNDRWQKALQAHIESIQARDWLEFLDKGVAEKVLTKAPKFARVDISDHVCNVLQPLVDHATFVLLERVSEQSRVVRALLAEVDKEYGRLKYRHGAYRFDDVVEALGRANPADPTEMFHRMGGPIDHILLDEFQDTSLAQWKVLEPLVERVTAEPNRDRSFFVVGDAKQAIYSWRGGEAKLLETVAGRLGSEPVVDSRSWRSSQVVIDLVNRLFQDVAAAAPLDEPDNRSGAEDWSRAFEQHRTVKTDLPGYASLVAVPKNDDSDGAGGALSKAADTIQDIVTSGRPGRTVAVLFRKNKQIPRMIHELSRRGITASEEGGNPLTDSPAVTAVLSLMILADHPGHRAARFHVANSPLGRIVGLEGQANPPDCRTVASEVRRSLQVDGYARTLRRWLQSVASDCNDRDFRRLNQLVQLAHCYDRQAAVRATDFVDVVRRTKVEDPTTAPVRVMTIHQAKGLEFDAVVLPELEHGFLEPYPRLLVGKDGPLHPPRLVSIYVGQTHRQMSPNLMEMYAQWRRSVICDELCNLYVAITRARQAVYMITAVSPSDSDKKGKVPLTFGGILRERLSEHEPDDGEGILYEAGDCRWYDLPTGESDVPADTSTELTVRPELARSSRQHRNLPHRTPSGAVSGYHSRLSNLLRLDDSKALMRGSVFHAWFQQVLWLEEAPDERVLREVASGWALEEDTLAKYIRDFRRMCQEPELRRALSRDRYPADIEVEVFREHPFVVLLDEEILRGQFDRLVIGRRGNRVVVADILDYKTDNCTGQIDKAIEDLTDQYRPQMEAYRQAAAKLTGLAVSAIDARLAFVGHGRVTAL